MAVILTYSFTSLVYSRLVNKASFIPVMSMVLIAIVIICFIVAHFTVKSIIKPIEDLYENIDNIDEIKSYDELKPLIKTLKEQNLQQTLHMS